MSFLRRSAVDLTFLVPSVREEKGRFVMVAQGSSHRRVFPSGREAARFGYKDSNTDTSGKRCAGYSTRTSILLL